MLDVTYYSIIHPKYQYFELRNNLVSCLAAQFPLLWVREFIAEHCWVIGEKKILCPLHEKVRSQCGSRVHVKVLEVMIRVCLEQSR